mgnify:FL=1
MLDRFTFLGDLDERDHLFLELAGHLLQKPIPERSKELVQQIEYPLAWLMEGIPISAEAAALRQDDIRVFIP